MESNKATTINLLDVRTPPMRAFHMAWLAFFCCFFAWFAIAPLMPVIRDEFQLTKAQVGNIVIIAGAITIFARLIIGYLCDRYGPRLTYGWLMILTALPVMGIGLARDYTTFLLFRLAIGAIGASFVVTQFHTSLMFGSRCVGTANATTAGWGNLGGGVSHLVMPLIFTGFLGLGLSEFWSWRVSMVVAGLPCIVVGIAYFFLTQDTPEGNYLRAANALPSNSKSRGSLWRVCKDYRVWCLFFLYGASFGLEITITNIAALYFTDYFALSLKTAGLVASLFGLLNIFARALGGIASDKLGNRWGVSARTRWLFAVVLAEGVFLILFSQMTTLWLAIALMVIFSLFVQMGSGATFAVVPFVSRSDLGMVSGIVGAGGNVGAVAAGFLFRGSLNWSVALLILGVLVFIAAWLALVITIAPESQTEHAATPPERILNPLPSEPIIGRS